VTEPNATIRASSLWEIFDCAHRFEARYFMNLRRPSSGAAALGTAIHASTAAFDQCKVIGLPVSIDAAAGVLVDRLRDPGYEVDWTGTNKREQERIGISLHTKYCSMISPKYTFSSVEMTLDPLDVDVDGYVIRLTGTMDRGRVARSTGGLGIRDVKSGGRIIDQKTGKAQAKSHIPQLGVYELLAEHTLGMPITEPAGIIGLQTTKHTPVGECEVPGAKALLLGTPEQPGYLAMAASILKSGIFPPNTASSLCSEKFCPRWEVCSFRPR
jgi:RecB family exonuclease